jgi:hypothetical protein
MTSPFDVSEVVLKDYTRVAGTYALTYSVEHVLSGFTLDSAQITVTVFSNCDTV